jgi:hypothetical protein
MRPFIRAVLLALLSASAAPLGAQAAGPASASARPESVYVEVRNERDVPVTVYLKFGLFDRRLGEVAPGRSATLAVPDWATRDRSTLRLLVYAEGDAADLGTKAFVVQSPGRLELVIPARGWTPQSPEDTMTAVLAAEEVEATTITVENPRDRAVTVYAEHGDFDVRLGRVPAGGHATLRMPKAVVGHDRSVRIFVHPDGGTDLASSLLRVKRGEHLGLRVPKS